MANLNLFKTLMGRLAPAADTVNEAGGTAYTRDAREALASGKVRLDGVPTADPGRDVDPARVSFQPNAPRIRVGRDLVVIRRDARLAVVSLTWRNDGTLAWEVRDDGVGLADPSAALLRGSGLAGIKERIWALGADLQFEPAEPGAPRPGLRLHATLQVPADDAAPRTSTP